MVTLGFVIMLLYVQLKALREADLTTAIPSFTILQTRIYSKTSTCWKFFGKWGHAFSLLFLLTVPLLKSLHWLPVHYRIILKICKVAYQALSSTLPAYLNSMLTPARNSRQLRSTSSNPLYIPRVKTKVGTQAFSVAAPNVWNLLPASVKSEGNIVSFRRCLKTYLFNAVYPP